MLEGYLLSGDENFLERARWQIASCAFDGKPPKHRPISLWASLFYMDALARYIEMFPEDASAKAYLLAHVETLRKSAGPANGILHTITPQPDGTVVGRGTCSHYNILAADLLAAAYRLTGRADYLDTARRCFAYGVKNANGQSGPATYFQVHSANGAMHGNVFMTTERKAFSRKFPWRFPPRKDSQLLPTSCLGGDEGRQWLREPAAIPTRVTSHVSRSNDRDRNLLSCPGETNN